MRKPSYKACFRQISELRAHNASERRASLVTAEIPVVEPFIHQRMKIGFAQSLTFGFLNKKESPHGRENS
jgi:hypothetical protein